MNPSFDFKWLKSRITIAQALSAYGLDSHLKLKNDTLYGSCPLHQGNNPTAFRVDLTRGGCGIASQLAVVAISWSLSGALKTAPINKLPDH